MRIKEVLMQCCKPTALIGQYVVMQLILGTSFAMARIRFSSSQASLMSPLCSKSSLGHEKHYVAAHQEFCGAGESYREVFTIKLKMKVGEGHCS